METPKKSKIEQAIKDIAEELFNSSESDDLVLNTKRVEKDLPGRPGIKYWAWSDDELAENPITADHLGKKVQWAEMPGASVTLISAHAPNTPGWKHGGFRISVGGVDSHSFAFLDSLKSLKKVKPRVKKTEEKETPKKRKRKPKEPIEA